MNLVPSNLIQAVANTITMNVEKLPGEKNGNKEAGNDSSDDDIPLDTIAKRTLKRDGELIYRSDFRSFYACNTCSYDTNKKYLLLRHMKIHSKDQSHKGPQINSGITDDKDNKLKVDRFEKEQITAMIKATSTTESNSGNDDERAMRRMFACEKCSYNTCKRDLFTRHQKTHSEERPYKCKICERGFKFNTSLKTHLNVHYGIKKHSCKDCNSSFITTGELIRHVRYKHTHEKPYKCTECEYEAVERSKLLRHMTCHNGERPHQCEHCTYASHSIINLKRHLRVHTGEKPYICEYCNESFSQSNTLKMHKLVHKAPANKTTIYLCELCPATRSRKAALRDHVQRMHFAHSSLVCKWCKEIFPDRYHYVLHKPQICKRGFKCQLCPYSANKFSDLDKHMAIHTRKTFNCDICNETFNTKSHLSIHQKKSHNRKSIQKEKCYACPECNRTFAYKGFLNRHQVLHKIKN